MSTLRQVIVATASFGLFVTASVSASAGSATVNDTLTVTDPQSKAPNPITPVFALITNFTGYTGPFPFKTGTFRVGETGAYRGVLSSPGVSNGLYILRGQFSPSTGTPSTPLSSFIIFSQQLTLTTINNIQLNAGEEYSYVWIFSAGNSPLTFTVDGPGCVSFASLCFDKSLTLPNNFALTSSSPEINTASGVTVTHSGVVSGTTPLTKTGAGSLILNGVNTYTGATNVNAGTLVVNGSIAPSSGLNIGAGGTVGGVGILPSTIVGGTLAPGNSIGTLSVQGNLTFNPGSVYAVEFSPTDADRTNVSGVATLNGGTVQATALPGSFSSRSYTILNAAGGVTGTFSGLTLSGADLGTQVRSARLAYDGNNVFLVLDPALINLSQLSLGLNQYNVGASINAAVTRGATPPAMFDALLSMDPGSLTRSLSQLSGEAATGVQQSSLNAMDNFLGAMTDGTMGSRGEAATQGGSSGPATTGSVMAFADTAEGRSGKDREVFNLMAMKGAAGVPAAQRWRVWATGYGLDQRSSGRLSTGSSDRHSQAYGLIAGADYRLSDQTVLGFSLGGGASRYSLSNAVGSGRSDLFQVGVFGRHGIGNGYLSAALAYGWLGTTTDRTALLNSYRAEFDVHALSGRIEGGYRFAHGAFGVTPYAAAQATRLSIPSYAERLVAGSNAFALSYTGRDLTAPRAELGLRFDASMPIENGQLTLRGRVAWAQNFETDRQSTAAFQAIPNSYFVVNGAAQGRNAALVNASAETRWANGVSLQAAVDGEFSSRTRTYGAKLTYRYQW